jgi:uncharacterized protein
MKEFIELIAKQLVNSPDKVRVETLEEETDRERYLLYVEPADRGKIIGRQGRTIKAFRVLVGAIAARKRRRASFEIIDDAPPPKRRSQ